MSELKKDMSMNELMEVMSRDRLTIQEVLTKSEGTSLFLTVLDKKLLDSYAAVPAKWNLIADEIITDSDIRLPQLAGMMGYLKPELSEIQMTDLDITGTTYSLNSFGLRVGISQEMIEDNKIGLIGYLMEKAGQRMKELEDIEVFKCLDTFNATGRAVNTYNTFLGQEDRGVWYTTGAFTNGLSASAQNWEDVIATAMATMQIQTRTVNGKVYPFPIYTNTIICNPSREMSIRKVLGPATTVVQTGLAGNFNVGAGGNIFQGALNIVSTPRLAARQAYITEAKKGLVLFRHPLYAQPRVEKTANFPIDAQEIKAISRFMPAVVEQRAFYAVLT
jgi:hypothetical protein